MAFAQSMEMPEMPEMPSMPTVGGGFYTPSFPNRPNKTQPAATDTDPAKDKNESVLTEAITPESILNSALTKGNTLTATDISSLYDSGLFSNISSLGAAGSLSNYTTSTSTNVLLQQVLNSLNELKKQQQTASAKEKNELNAVKTDSETFKKREPSILRFKINNYSVKDSITQEFFSEPEPDGSFLLTADRKYLLNNRSCTETFYLLFKAVKSNGSSTTFSVTPSVAQGTENKNSYIYKMCQLKDITAQKTGNLVVVHYDDNGVAADLLLDIDK